MRIIAGTHEGRRFDAPKGQMTRPTSDFVREAAFNLIGPARGRGVLDLYAGSGGLGLEALSRGRRAASSSTPRGGLPHDRGGALRAGAQRTVLCRTCACAHAPSRGAST